METSRQKFLAFLLLLSYATAVASTGSYYASSSGLCSEEFGRPKRRDCLSAFADVPGDDLDLQHFYGKAYSSSNYLLEGGSIRRNQNDVLLPVYWRTGTCVISLYLPRLSYDSSLWVEVKEDMSHLLRSCIGRGSNMGGFRWTGRRKNILLTVYEAPEQMGNDNHNEVQIAQRLADARSMPSPGSSSGGSSGSWGSVFSDQSPIPGYNKRCRVDGWCTSKRQCGDGCSCVATKLNAIAQSAFVAVCGYIARPKSGLRPRALVNDGEIIDSPTCLCNSSFAHPECCHGGKFGPDTTHA